MKKLLVLPLLLFVLAGCDEAIESNYTPKIVVDGFIYAGEPIDSVVLHYTVPFTSAYDDSAFAITDADVRVTVDGNEFQLQPIPNKRGRYFLPASSLIVQGGKTYDLSVKVNELTVHSTTIVPMPISITNRDSAFPSDKVLILDTNDATTFNFTLLAGPTQADRLYMLQVTALDTTFGKVNTGPQGPPIDTSAYVRYSFIQTAPNIKIYSRLFGWFGPNKLTFLSLDNNWVDYKRAVGYGDDSFLPYQPSLNHIEGGYGIWASAAKDTITVFLKVKN
jgi:hypothetical protein